jgi:hypothetical protein
MWQWLVTIYNTISRRMLEGGSVGLARTRVNFRLTIRFICYQHRKCQIIQTKRHYENIYTHPYIGTSSHNNYHNENKIGEENTACWCESVVNKLPAHIWCILLVKFSNESVSKFGCNVSFLFTLDAKFCERLTRMYTRNSRKDGRI